MWALIETCQTYRTPQLLGWLTRVTMLTPIHQERWLKWAYEHQNWIMEQQKKVALSAETKCALYHLLPREEMASRRKSTWRRHCDALCSVPLGNFGSWHLCERYCGTYHLLNIVAGQVQPFMMTVFTNVSVFFSAGWCTLPHCRNCWTWKKSLDLLKI